MDTPIIAVIVIVLLSLFVGGSMGRKRRIGEGWAIFFMMTGSFLLGLIITSFSPLLTKLPKYIEDKKKINIIIGIVIGIVAVAAIYRTVHFFSEPILIEEEKIQNYEMLDIALFLTGSSIYFIQRNKRNREVYNKSLKNKSEEGKS